MGGKITQIGVRIGSLEGCMTVLDTRIDARMTAIKSRVANQVPDVLKWLIDMMIPTWFGVIAALTTQFLKTG